MGERRAGDRRAARSTSTTCSSAAPRGEPLQYVLGRWEFLGLDLLVDPRVLVPRPETEVVAQTAIDEVGAARRAARARTTRGRRRVTAYAVADLGTGSGALALALASRAARRRGVGHRRERGRAGGRARQPRGRRFGRRRGCASRAGSWFDALPDELRGRAAARRVEPAVRRRADEVRRRCRARSPTGSRGDALVSGPTGLEALERIVARGARRGSIRAAACSCCELAPHQAEAMAGARDRAGLRRRVGAPRTSPAAIGCSSPVSLG